MFQISRGEQEPIGVKNFKELKLTIHSSKPGRYRIDEISADPLPPGRQPQLWGIGINWADGSVEIERDPWLESPSPP
jgi:hypothetical protein